MARLYKNVVIITGVCGGIGLALKDVFQNHGYKIIGLDILSQTKTECDLYISCDLGSLASDKESQDALFNQIDSFLSQQDLCLTALINNAALQVVKPLDELTYEDFDSTLEVNVLAPFVLSQMFKGLLQKNRGSIVNIGSIHDKLTKPDFCAYSTSKAALSGLTRALALELAPDVTVNMVSPAATNTQMLKDSFRANPEKMKDLEACHPVGRLADPQEIARTVLFICSQDTGFMTGTNIYLDGGVGGRLHDPL